MQWKSDGEIIYERGDPGHDLFFVASGVVCIRLPSKDDCSLLQILRPLTFDSLVVLWRKEALFGHYYGVGNHFGEHSILSREGVRPDWATAMMATELYTLNELSLLEILKFTSVSIREKMLISLMSTIGSWTHTNCPPVHAHNEGIEIGSSTFRKNDLGKELFELSLNILSNMIYLLEQEGAGDVNPGQFHCLEDVKSPRMSSPMTEFESQDGSEWVEHVKTHRAERHGFFSSRYGSPSSTQLERDEDTDVGGAAYTPGRLTIPENNVISEKDSRSVKSPLWTF